MIFSVSKYRNSFYLLCFLISGGLHFFSPASAQLYNFRNYNIDNGLPQSYVQAILQDSHGYMWLGTADGLVRFDGKTFRTFSSKDGIANNYIACAMKDKTGTLWFGSQDGTVTLFDPGKNEFRIYEPIAALTGQARLNTIYRDSKERIWFGTFGEGVILLEEGKLRKFTSSSDDVGTRVFSITEDKKGRIWFAAIEGLFVYENNIFKKVPWPGNYEVYSVLSDKKGNLWIGTRANGICVVPAAFILEPKLDHERIRRGLKCFSINEGLVADWILAVIEDSEGNIWLGTPGKGISKFIIADKEKITGYFKNFTTGNGLAHNDIWTFYEDREKNIWIGTLGGGVSQFRFNDERFESYSVENGLKSSQIWAICQVSDNQLWIGSDGGLTKATVSSFSGKLTDINNFNNHELLSQKVLSIFAEPTGTVWVGTDGNGLYRLNTSGGPIEKFFRHGDEETRISAITKDKSGNLWIGTYGGLIRFNPQSKETLILTTEDGLPTNVINHLYYDGSKYLWIATEGGGLSRFDGVRFVNFNKSNGLPHETVYCVTRDRKGIIWFGTLGGGLYRYDGKQFRNYTKRDHLSSDNVYSVICDNANQVWAGTSSGADRLDQKTGQFKHYGKAEGFLGGEANLNAACKGNNDLLWFGTINGVVRYNPQKDLPNSVEPLTYITGIKLFQRDTLDMKMDELSHKQNHLTFDFIALSFTLPENIRYKFKLVGFDEDWSPETQKTDYTYSNLPPGEYTFKVIASNNDGKWNKNPASFSFIITPPFYQTTWFYISSSLFILGCIYAFLKIRTAQLVKAKQILETQVKERTMEVVKQKVEIEQKNKDITDSITYAKRIQEAILPVKQDIQRKFSGSFVFFRPRDIVSGDFYWYAENGPKSLLAMVDCTGHGVPGAFMSIVGNTSLNEIVNERKILVPGDVLQALNEKVTYTLKQEAQESETRDGMDIALVAIDFNKMELQYAGANRPLYVIKDQKLIEVKGNSFPIGGYYEEQKIFQTHTLPVTKGDSVYLFSDGYADQFGGPGGKKFMTKRLKELLLSIQSLTMSEQEEKLLNSIENWRGQLDQVDDILVMGLRF